jgi:hypothetical protein
MSGEHWLDGQKLHAPRSSASELLPHMSSGHFRTLPPPAVSRMPRDLRMRFSDSDRPARRWPS